MEAVLATALGWEAGAGSDPAGADIASEAVHLADVLALPAPGRADPRARLALILQVQARKGARAGGDVRLAEPDVWMGDHAMIRRADAHLAAAGTMGQLRRFQLAAAIPSVLARRRRTGRTNRPPLHTLHAALQRLAARLGGAVAPAAVVLKLQGAGRRFGTA